MTDDKKIYELELDIVRKADGTALTDNEKEYVRPWLAEDIQGADGAHVIWSVIASSYFVSLDPPLTIGDVICIVSPRMRALRYALPDGTIAWHGLPSCLELRDALTYGTH